MSDIEAVGAALAGALPGRGIDSPSARYSRRGRFDHRPPELRGTIPPRPARPPESIMQ